MSDKKKILLLSASVGSGHVRAAQAVADQLVSMPGVAEVRSVDMLKFANKPFRLIYSKLYLKIATSMPNLFESMFEQSDIPWKDNHRREIIAYFNTMKICDLIEDFKPDLIISTHFLASDLVSRLKLKGKLTAPLAVVVTDIDMHAWWLCRAADHYFIASYEVREYLLKLGVPPEIITVAGIPIDAKFAQKHDKGKVREALGLRTDMTTVLISSGGDSCGSGVRMIEQMAQINTPAQFIVVCARNTKLKDKLDEYVANLQNSRHKFTILGFTDIMDQYMSASDILVGKSGGLTTAEAMAKNLAIVIVEPLKGQEQRNSDFLLEEGIAIRCNNLVTMSYKIEKLLNDPARLAAMQNNAKRLAAPHAAVNIAQKALALASKP